MSIPTATSSEAATETVQTSLGKLLAFLDRLESVNLWYRLIHVRDSIMVRVSVPGEMWEVEFFEDGHVEIERYVSTGAIEDEDALATLFETYSD